VWWKARSHERAAAAAATAVTAAATAHPTDHRFGNRSRSPHGVNVRHDIWSYLKVNKNIVHVR